MRKEIWFGLSILIAIVVALFALMPAPADMTNGHLGLLMLALVVCPLDTLPVPVGEPGTPGDKRERQDAQTQEERPAEVAHAVQGVAEHPEQRDEQRGTGRHDGQQG